MPSQAAPTSAPAPTPEQPPRPDASRPARAGLGGHRRSAARHQLAGAATRPGGSSWSWSACTKLDRRRRGGGAGPGGVHAARRRARRPVRRPRRGHGPDAEARRGAGARLRLDGSPEAVHLGSRSASAGRCSRCWTPRRSGRTGAVYVVRAGEKRLVLGVTQNQITALAELDAEAHPSWRHLRVHAPRTRRCRQVARPARQAMHRSPVPHRPDGSAALGGTAQGRSAPLVA